MRSTRSAVLLVAALAGGCSQSGAPSAQPSPNPPRTSRSCPLAVEGARIDVADAAGGLLLTVRASPDRVDELRHRVRDVAALHGPGAHKGLGHHGRHLCHQRHGLQLTRMPPITTEVANIDGGATLRLTAVVPSHVDRLREQVREEVDRVNAGPCE